MLYLNPWADSPNFINLGSATLLNGKTVDLYALKTSDRWYQIGVRYSNEPSNYGSGTELYLSKGKHYCSHKPLCYGAYIALQRLTAQEIKQPVYDGHNEKEILFNAEGVPMFCYKQHYNAVTLASVKAGYLPEHLADYL